MLILFFKYLIAVWLPINSKQYEAINREAIDYYYWLLLLKREAFRPVRNKVDARYKLAQVQKALAKQPFLTPQFYNALIEIQSIASIHHPKDEIKLLLDKRFKLAQLRDWLLTFDYNTQLATLQQMLIEQSEPAVKSFLRKRNNRYPR